MKKFYRKYEFPILMIALYLGFAVVLCGSMDAISYFELGRHLSWQSTR